MKGSLGDDNEQELRVVANTPVIEDMLAAKVFFTSQKADGFRDDVTIGGDVADVDYQNYGATLLFAPNDAFEATFTAEKFLEESVPSAYHTNPNTAPGVIPPPTDPNETNCSGGFLNCLPNDTAFGGHCPNLCRRTMKAHNHAENDTDNNTELDNTWREASPRLGRGYQIDESALACASYAEGFHSGGFFGVNQNTRDLVRDQYDPEYANTFELGYKSLNLEDRLLLSATASYTEFDDKQEQSIQFDPDAKAAATTFDSVASAVYWGIELETQYVLNDCLRVFFNHGHLDAEYDDFETDINAVDGVTLIEGASFLEPRNAPENTFGAGGTITWPIGPGTVQLYGKQAWIDEMKTNLSNTPLGHVDDRKDVTASLGYFGENWAVTAHGKNLTDEEFETFFPIATLFAVGSVNRPRIYGIELEYDF